MIGPTLLARVVKLDRVIGDRVIRLGGSVFAIVATLACKSKIVLFGLSAFGEREDVFDGKRVGRVSLL